MPETVMKVAKLQLVRKEQNSFALLQAKGEVGGSGMALP